MSEQQETYGFSLPIQKKILAMFLFQSQSYLQNIEIVKPEFFDSPTLAKIVEMVNRFYMKYKRVPNQDELVEEIDVLLDEDNRLSREEFARVLEEVLITGVKGKFEYVRDKALDFAKYQGVKNAIIKGAEKYLPQKNYERIVSEIRDAMSVGQTMEDLGIDYLKELEQRLVKRSEGNVRSTNAIPTLIPEFDKSLGGGIAPPELAILMSPMKRGKTMTAVNFGANATAVGKNVIFYGLEGNKERTQVMFDAKISGISKDEINSDNKEVREHAVRIVRKRVNEWFSNDRVGRLWIQHYPAGTCSVLTIENHIQKLRMMEDFIPDLLLIDYLGLMNVSDSHVRIEASTSGTYHKLGVITKELLSLAQRHNLAIWLLHQASKASLKKVTVGLEDSGDSSIPLRDAYQIVTINQTKEEEDRDPPEMRLTIVGGRDVARKTTVVCVDKSKINIWEKGFN